MSKENIKISDLVVITNQSENIPENIIPGGRVVMMFDAVVLVQRSNGAILSYNIEHLRLLTPEDMRKEGIELY